MTEMSPEDACESLRKLCLAGQALKAAFVAKEDIIDMMIVCAIAQEPMVIFGEPGTAKSAMVSWFCDALNIQRPDYFRYLLTQFTEVDELLGVVDIKRYTDEKEPRFRRWSAGSMHQARIVFLDEVFRANSAILNTLLSVINERVYYEAGSPRPAKVQVVYGAANTPPVGAELAAFYGRFAIRLRSDRVSDIQPKNLLDRGWRLETVDLALRSEQLSISGEDKGRQHMSVEEREAQERMEIADRERERRGHQRKLYRDLRTRPPDDLSLSDVENCQAWLRTHWEPAEHGGAWDALSPFRESYLAVVRRLNAVPEQFGLDDRKVIKLFKVVLAHAMYRHALTAAGDTGEHPDDWLQRCHPCLDDVYCVLRHTWELPAQKDVAADFALYHVQAEDADRGAKLGER